MGRAADTARAAVRCPVQLDFKGSCWSETLGFIFVHFWRLPANSNMPDLVRCEVLDNTVSPGIIEQYENIVSSSCQGKAAVSGNMAD